MVFYLPSSEFDIIPNIISKQPTVLLCFLQDHYCIPCLGKKLVLFWIAQHISVLFSSVICGLTSSSLFHVFLADIWKTDGRSEDSAAPKLYHLLWERDRPIKWIKRENYIPTAAACPKLAAASLAEGLPSRETSCLNVETGTGGSSSFSCTAFGFQQEASLDIDQMHEKKKKVSKSFALCTHWTSCCLPHLLPSSAWTGSDCKGGAEAALVLGDFALQLQESKKGRQREGPTVHCAPFGGEKAGTIWAL